MSSAAATRATPLAAPWGGAPPSGPPTASTGHAPHRPHTYGRPGRHPPCHRIVLYGNSIDTNHAPPGGDASSVPAARKKEERRSRARAAAAAVAAAAG